ncbi:uncharacterized protein LOC112136727 [Oryzias melastigma]|uniref:Uncharacterized LOC112136727 n=1 Tax=Oryzias melastigma TaxID=30732 RepID=A0A3B3DZN2_ORYME|nr:uncharacterized protein LOC112136727 [Oryzias melastigma]
MAELVKFVSNAKNVAEMLVDVFQKGASIVTILKQELLPIFSAVGPLFELSVNKPDDPDVVAVRDQFGKLSEHLVVVSNEASRIPQVLQKNLADLKYFEHENTIRTHYRNYLEVLGAKPEFREVKKRQFLGNFSPNNEDESIDRLYRAVVEDYPSKPLLQIILDYEERTQSSVEEFCGKLLHLFCIGIIVVLAHAVMSGNGKEEKLQKEWGEKMAIIQKKMKAAIEECGPTSKQS